MASTNGIAHAVTLALVLLIIGAGLWVWGDRRTRNRHFLITIGGALAMTGCLILGVAVFLPTLI